MGSLIVSHGHGLSRLMVMVHGRGSSMEKNDGELIFYFSIFRDLMIDKQGFNGMILGLNNINRNR